MMSGCQPSLLSLPLELRLTIYRYLLSQPAQVHNDYPVGLTSLIQTCRQIQHEAKPVLYQDNVFSIIVRLRFQEDLQVSVEIVRRHRFYDFDEWELMKQFQRLKIFVICDDLDDVHEMQDALRTLYDILSTMTLMSLDIFFDCRKYPDWGYLRFAYYDGDTDKHMVARQEWERHFPIGIEKTLQPLGLLRNVGNVKVHGIDPALTVQFERRITSIIPNPLQADFTYLQNHLESMVSMETRFRDAMEKHDTALYRQNRAELLEKTRQLTELCEALPAGL